MPPRAFWLHMTTIGNSDTSIAMLAALKALTLRDWLVNKSKHGEEHSPYKKLTNVVLHP
jgi:hypothetical protein